MHKLVDIIADTIPYSHNPAVYISGGVDSTVILHHVCEMAMGQVYTYTARFRVEEDQCEQAREVAKHYGTIHREVPITDFVLRMPEILKYFDRPRYNIWIWWLAEELHGDDRKLVFCGEGADEHFGGYPSRGYLEGWANHIAYIEPTYNYIHDHFGIKVIMPYDRLCWEDTFKYFKPNKQAFRDAYRGIILDKFLDRPKTPPAFKEFWIQELKRLYPDNQGDPYLALQILVAKAWVQVREGELYCV